MLEVIDYVIKILRQVPQNAAKGSVADHFEFFEGVRLEQRNGPLRRKANKFFVNFFDGGLRQFEMQFFENFFVFINSEEILLVVESKQGYFNIFRFALDAAIVALHFIFIWFGNCLVTQHVGDIIFSKLPYFLFGIQYVYAVEPTLLVFWEGLAGKVVKGVYFRFIRKTSRLV